MKKVLAILAAGAFVALGAAPAQAATPAATYSYDMDGSFTDSIGSSTLAGAAICSSPSATELCNVAANFGSDSIGDYWHWRTTQINGGGATLVTPADLGNSYSLYFKFAIDDEANDTDSLDCSEEDNNFSKILDLRNQATDVGLYTKGCDPLYISTGYVHSEASIDRGNVVEVVLTRDGTNDEVTIFINYADGFAESFVYDDADGDFIAADQGSGSLVRLFQDDGDDNGNPTHEGIQEGRLYGLKIWANDVLTLDEIESLATVTPESNKPEALAPTGANAQAGLWAILLALVATAGAVAVRRNVKA